MINFKKAAMFTILPLFTVMFGFNASAYSFTERMSAQNKPSVETQQKSTLTKEDKALKDESCPVIQDYSQLVQALLIIIAFMTTVIYLQNKKIHNLLPKEDEK